MEPPNLFTSTRSHASDCSLPVSCLSIICRRIARELVEKWSRPIFDQYREQGPEVQRQRDLDLAAARQRRQLREAKSAAAQGGRPPFSVRLCMVDNVSFDGCHCAV